MEPQWHPQASGRTVRCTTYDYIAPEKHQGKLNGKTVLITGASKGIGRATAEAFFDAGANVACVARSQDKLQSLVTKLQAKDGPQSPVRAIAIAGDVRDGQFAANAVEKTAGQFGQVDILINNAGISRLSDIEHEDGIEASWRVIETNMLGSMTFIHAVVPTMKARGSGTIINVVSIIGQITLPYFAAYAASKAGMVAYTKSMAMELSPKNIKTFALHPCMSKETSIGEGALNEKAAAAVPDLNKFLTDFLESEHDQVDLPAHTMVALCTEPDAEILSGEFVDATYDLSETIHHAKMVKERH